MLLTIFNSEKDLEKALDHSEMQWLKLRFSNYLKLSNTLILEEKYVDREWREEYSIVYSFTSYENISSLTKRIHLFSSKITELSKIGENKDCYFGYIVLRPAPTNRILKAVLKPTKEALEVDKDQRLFMPLCKFETHIGSEEFPIEAFPFYSQDSMVTVCAHASMFMDSLYLSKKQLGVRPSLRDFIKHTPTLFGRNMPSEALTPAQMLSILSTMGYNVRLTSFQPKERTEHIAECMVEIDTHVESGLPPLLMYGQHVVLVVGHTLKDGKKDYIIFDDSSFHLKTLMKSTLFACRVSSEVLKKELGKQDWVFIGSFEYERQYFPLKSVKLLIQETFELDYHTQRILLVDSKNIKSFYKNTIPGIENFNLPHYLWLIEIYKKKDLVGGLLLDASVHKLDYLGSLIASWNFENVKFYKYSDSLIKTGASLVPFTNLKEILK